MEPIKFENQFFPETHISKKVVYKVEWVRKIVVSSSEQEMEQISSSHFVEGDSPDLSKEILYGLEFIDENVIHLEELYVELAGVYSFLNELKVNTNEKERYEGGKNVLLRLKKSYESIVLTYSKLNDLFFKLAQSKYPKEIVVCKHLLTVSTELEKSGKKLNKLRSIIVLLNKKIRAHRRRLIRGASNVVFKNSEKRNVQLDYFENKMCCVMSSELNESFHTDDVQNRKILRRKFENRIILLKKWREFAIKFNATQNDIKALEALIYKTSQLQAVTNCTTDLEIIEKELQIFCEKSIEIFHRIKSLDSSIYFIQLP